MGLSATNGNEQVSPVYAMVLIILALPVAAAGAAIPGPARQAPLLIAVAVSTALALRLATPIAIGPYAASAAPLGTLAAGPWKGLAFLPGGDLAPERDQPLDPTQPRAARHALQRVVRLAARRRGHPAAARRSRGTRAVHGLPQPLPLRAAAPAPLGDHLYWHFGRNIGMDNAPRPEALFAGVDWVMVPKVPIFREVSKIKADLYLPWILEHYRKVSLARVGDRYEDVQTAGGTQVESEWWTCYRRR